MSDENERIVSLERMLSEARSTAARLEGSARSTRRNTAIFGAALVLSLGLVAYAGPSSMSAAPAAKDPIIQLNQKMADMEKRLQHDIDLLQLRVKRLEDKPDNVDDEETKKEKGENKGGSETNGPDDRGAASNAQADAQFKNMPSHTVTAPFIVKDRQGRLLMIVDDTPNRRNARMYSEKGDPVAVMGGGSDNGGYVIAYVGNGQKDTYAVMSATNQAGPKLTMRVDNKQKVSIGSADGESYVKLMGDTTKPNAGMMAWDSGKGEFDVYNHDGQPIASLVRGVNGGKLELSDIAGALMVEAGTEPDHVGLVRTGPASRAPGGLMGVPGSWISGKGH